MDGALRGVVTGLDLADLGSPLAGDLARLHGGVLTLASGVIDKAAESEPATSSLVHLAGGLPTPLDGAGDPGLTLVADTPRGRGPVTAGITAAWTALQQAGLSELDLPLPGAAPVEAMRWWASLAPEHQALYLSAYPGRIGALDGLPAADRHTANMTALRALIEDQQEIGRTALQDGRFLPYLFGVDQMRLDRLTSLLGRLEAAEQSPDAAPLYLLGIDDALQGRAIVAVGNPDTARHVGVLVPGILNTLSSMGTLIDRADLLRSTSMSLNSPEQSGEVSVIAWLGYDSPGLDVAALQGRAEAGAPLLRRFVEGLRVSSALDPGVDGQARLGIIAHSYGAVLTGVAASRGDGLLADVYITLGAPGMTVPDASLLRGPVWSGAFDGEFVSSWGPIVHGTAPHTWEFGGNRFFVDVNDHGLYWQRGSVSLENQVQALFGNYFAITPDLTDLTRRLTVPGPDNTLTGPRPPLVVPPVPPTDVPPPNNLLGPRTDVAPGEFLSAPGISVGYGTPVNYSGYTPVAWQGVLSGQSDVAPAEADSVTADTTESWDDW